MIRREQVTIKTDNLSLANGVFKHRGFLTLSLLKQEKRGGFDCQGWNLPQIMVTGKLYIAESGKIYNAEDVEIAEKINDLYQLKDPWAVIDELFRIWAKRKPDEYKELIEQISDLKEQLTDPTYGQTHGGKDLERRFITVFPMTLQLLIRTQYKANELPFDTPFYKKFLERYSKFKIAEKV